MHASSIESETETPTQAAVCTSTHFNSPAHRAGAALRSAVSKPAALWKCPAITQCQHSMKRDRRCYLFT